MMKLLKLCAYTVVFFAFSATTAFGQVGKIEGRVLDAETGNPIPGANVVIEGTTQGAQTNVEGHYTILNVSPGTYTLTASFVGYATQRVEGVRVNIDLTTEQDFALQERTEQLEEVTVQAEEPIVKRDISANVVNTTAEEMESVPVTSLEGIIGLGAGAEGLSIRGSGADELSLNVDGMNMREGRSQSPVTNISYTSIDQIQVQTGGFNAEYGNVRSGLINVVTKEGPRNRYTADMITKYAPAQKEYFGPDPNALDSYWLRPYFDPEARMIGTQQAWDRYTQRQYPEFAGYNEYSRETFEGNDRLGDNATPEQVMENIQYTLRRDLVPRDPDYTIDASFGGPVPLVSRPLGDLRFFASYRRDQNPYIIQMIRPANVNQSGHLKLTTNLASRIKLTLQGRMGREESLQKSSSGFASMYGGDDYSLVRRFSNIREMFGGYGFYTLPKDLDNNLIGAKFTHALRENTFYEVRAQRLHSEYTSHLPQFRDTSTVVFFGGRGMDEVPNGLGLSWENLNPLVHDDFTSHIAETRDSSRSTVWDFGFDLTSQLNEYMEVKTGVDYIYSLYDIRHGVYEWDYSVGPDGAEFHPEQEYRWERSPHQGAVFAQTKLDFEGMVANIGLRGDYFDPSTMWYDYEPFDERFAPAFGPEFENLVDRVRTKRHFRLAPRLGVSFPITAMSKLYFNYGHFHQMLNAHNIYTLRQVESGAINQIGNPDHPLPTTISYEVGYEQNIFNQLLLRITGYYKALEDQPRRVTFENLTGSVGYGSYYPLNYEDIRGIEFSLRRSVGRWVRGFANFTYMAEKTGNFGFSRQYENPTDQREHERLAVDNPNTPTPQPYARINLELMSPPDFGPSWGMVNPLGDWHASFLGSWRAGRHFTWDGGRGGVASTTDLDDNVRWKDRYMLDLRLSKNIRTGMGRVQVFADISNLFNFKYLSAHSSSIAFIGSNDWQHYMQSLHLPEGTFKDQGRRHDPYSFVYGDDQPGDYRKPGADFVPIEAFAEELPNRGMTRTGDRQGPLYYVKESGEYFVWDGESETFSEAEQGFVNQVLEEKAYIDMPNFKAFRFLNPRRVSFGLRVTL